MLGFIAAAKEACFIMGSFSINNELNHNLHPGFKVLKKILLKLLNLSIILYSDFIIIARTSKEAVQKNVWKDMKDKFIGSQKETWMEKAMLNDNVSENNNQQSAKGVWVKRNDL